MPSSEGSAIPAAAPAVPPAPAAAVPVIEVTKLNFDYCVVSSFKPVLKDINFTLPRGEWGRRGRRGLVSFV